MSKLCKHTECTRFVFAKGYCRYHQYLRADRKTSVDKKANKNEIDLPTLLEIAQKLHNTYIRLRDKEKGCISCKKGPVEHAGHYYAQGSHSSVRYDLVNTNGQCSHCNCALHGNHDGYVEGLKKRYSQQAREELVWMANNERFKKWTREELMEIIADRKARIKELTTNPITQ